MEPYPGRYVAFFDLDKTLLSVDSGSVFVKEIRRRGLISIPGLIKVIYLTLLFRLRHRNTLSVVLRMGNMIKGMPIARLEALTEYVVSNYLVNAIRPEILSEMGCHRKNGAEIVILSSAISQICGPMGEHVGADSVICTVLETNDGSLTGSAENGFCIGTEKRERLRRYCEDGNYALQDVYYYTDLITDLPSLEIVGHPVCVQPDRRLARLARGKGWRII